MLERDGVKLAARCSYITNHLNFCGPHGKSDVLFNYVVGKRVNSAQAKRHLSRFEGLLPYLGAVAAKNHARPFDFKVVEAYWIGNRLLNRFRNSDLIGLLGRLQKRGLPASITKELINTLPEDMLPHHSFNVFYVGVGSMTNSVKTTLQNMDRCRITCGLVRDVKRNSLVIKYKPLRIERKQITSGNYLKKNVRYHKAFLPEVAVNSLVAVHWNYGCCVLTEKQKEDLEYYTTHNINCLNSTQKR